jgi:hypothetical protein
MVWCSECDDFLCSDCLKQHKSSKLFNNARTLYECVRGRGCRDRKAEQCFVLIVLNEVLCLRSYCFLPSLCNNQALEYNVRALFI